MLKQSSLAGAPTYEELKTTRDAGADALAELVATRLPDQFTNIGVGAAVADGEQFIEALLRRGLDPNGMGTSGITPLKAAERHGPNSRTYQLLKVSSER